MKLLRGRDFTATEAENKDTPRVVIVDEMMAQALFPKGDALGQHIRYTNAPSDGSPNDLTIVGIVGKHRHEVLGEEFRSGSSCRWRRRITASSSSRRA